MRTATVLFENNPFLLFANSTDCNHSLCNNCNNFRIGLKRFFTKNSKAKNAAFAAK
jgi:hypothetical protein